MTGNGSAPQPRRFAPIAVRGWGDGWNAYVHSMAWFEGHLYCGTFRAHLCFKQRQKENGPQFPVWPIECPADLFTTVDLRAQIWRFNPMTSGWQEVYRSPMITNKEGRLVERECGYRGMAVVQGRGDAKPTLYVLPFTRSQSVGPILLRSEDGVTFHECSRPGLGRPGVSSFRFLVPFRGRLYTTLVGSTKYVVNESRYPIVFESAVPSSGTWHEASRPGFGEGGNNVIFQMAVFNDHLYAGTFNHDVGFQLWKTRAEGPRPYAWTKVIDLGAGRGNLNQGVLSMCEFNGALYIGTCIQDGGYDRAHDVGPAAGEIIRVHPDDSWQLIVGVPRMTDYGFQRPASGLGPGFGNPFNGYIWRMCVHANRLYVGTLSWKTFLPYVDTDKWPDGLRDHLDVDDVDEAAANGGFELWSTADGESWEPVTLNGFGNPYNCGARTLESTPYGLAVGTVNPFGPKVAVKRNGGWTYVANPRGGGEVWLGAP